MSNMTFADTLLNKIVELEDKIIANKQATIEELEFLQEEFKIRIMQIAEKLRNL